MLLSLFLICTPHVGDVLLPDGPAARAWAGVDPEARLEDEWIDHLGAGAQGLLALKDPWEDPAAWLAWNRWLSSGERTGAERGGLAILAVRGGRHADAWSHYATLVSDPDVAAAAMPRLLPGIPSDAIPGAALPDGCLLRPAAPPGALAAARGRVRPTTASVELLVGEAAVRLVISVEPSGVEVKLHHLSGGPASLRVQLPELLDREVRVSYIDWLRQDARNDPLAVELSPGMEGPVHLFGRFLARTERLPAPPTTTLPVQLLEAGLWFESTDHLAPTPLQVAASRAITDSLGVKGGARRAGSADGSSASAGTVVHLREGPEGARTLARIVSATEAWVIGR